MRGAGWVAEAFLEEVRITPACAGSRMGCGGFPGGGQDHPRLCGEQYMQTVIVIGNVGSPPPVRGAAFVNYLGEGATGITPACAGSSLF